MKLLALDTSTSHCTVALEVDGVCNEDNRIAANNHGDTLLLSIEALLEEANTNLSSLNAIACGIGPGSFTGLRLAVSVAQGLAMSANLPVIPISSLTILAQEAFSQFHVKKVITALDARMNQLYWQVFHVDEKTGLANPQGLTQLTSPEECWKNIIHDIKAFGNGFDAYPQNDKNIHILKGPENNFPKAKYLLMLAKEAFQQGNTLRADKLMPMYVRNDVTQENKA